jgi:hypothetical protein
MAAEPYFANPIVARPRRRWRVALAVAAVGIGVVASFLIWHSIKAARVRADLNQFIAELDHTEPGWRSEALEAARAKVPDAENNVPAIFAAKKAVSRARRFDVADFDRYKRMSAELSPNARLSDDQYGYCIDQLETIESAVPLVAEIARLPRGHCPITLSADGMSDRLVLINESGLVENWPTHLLVLVHAQEGELGVALLMCRVNLHIAAAIGDEQSLVCQLARNRHVLTATSGIERVLGQGAVPDTDLAVVHAELAAEATHDGWPVALRGERAWQHRAFDAVADRRLPMSQFRLNLPGYAAPTGWPAKARAWLEDRTTANLDEAHLWNLRFGTRLLRETAALPWHERNAALAKIAGADADAPPIWRLGLDRCKFFDRFQNKQARVQCAVVALAAERYRLRHGRWPDSLADLVPELLPAVPVDPFDGRPLRYLRMADGMVVYSIGPAMADHGGMLARDVLEPAARTNIGFRLWDPKSRGQAPAGN